MCRQCITRGKTRWRSHTAPFGSSSTTGHVTTVITVAVEELIWRCPYAAASSQVCFESFAYLVILSTTVVSMCFAKTSDSVWVVGTLFLPMNWPCDHFSSADHSSFVVVVGLIPFSADDHTVTSRQCQKAQNPAGQTFSQLLLQIIHAARPQPTVWRTAACRLRSGAYTVLRLEIATVGCTVSIGCWHNNKIHVLDTLASGSTHHSSSSF